MNVKKSLIYSGALSLLAVAIQFLLIMILGRSGAEYLGYFSIIEVSVMFVPTIILFGGDIFFQHQYNQYEDAIKAKCFLNGYFFSCIIFYFIILTLAYFFILYDLELIVMAAIFSSSFASFLLYFLSFYYRAEISVPKGALFERGYNFTFFVIFTLVATLVAYSKQLFFLAVILSALLCICFCLLKIARLDLIKFTSAKFDSVLFIKDISNRKSFYFFATGLLIFLYERLDQLIIVNIFDVVILGFYFACYKLSFIVRMMTSTIYSVTYPFMAKYLSIKDSGYLAVDLYNKTLFYTFILSFVIALFFMFFADDILLLVYGEDYVKYDSLLKIIIVSMLASTVNQINFSFLNAEGSSFASFYNGLLCVFAQLVVIYSMHETFGIYSIAYARLAAVLIGVFISFWLLKKITINNYYLHTVFILSAYVLFEVL